MVLPVLMGRQSPLQRDILLRHISLRKSKLENASELSAMFALFSLVGAVDLNINEGDASPALIIVFVVNTSLLVTNTVLVKIAIIWMTPRLDTAFSLSTYDLSEYDRIPHESLTIFWDIVWILASSVGFLIFGVEFILIVWIKYRHFSVPTVIASTCIMGVVLVFVVIAGGIGYYETVLKERKEALLLRRQEQVNSWGEQVL